MVSGENDAQGDEFIEGKICMPLLKTIEHIFIEEGVG